VSERVGGRRFCVPYNGDPALVEKCLDEHGAAIHEFYGCDGEFKSGRAVRPGGSACLERALECLRGTGVEFNYVLNALVLEEYLVERDRLERHLAWLRDIGVTCITLSSPYFLKLVKPFGFRASTSLLQEIRSENTARIYEDLGFDRIIVGEDETRNFGLIRSLAESLQVPLEIIVNNCCLRNCPFRLTHYNSEGNARLFSRPELIRDVSSFCHRRCRGLWYQDPRHFLMSSWTRPEELPAYVAAGVQLFKLAGRTAPTEAISKMLSLYAEGAYDGNVFDYLSPAVDAQKLYGLLPIDNREFAAYFAYFRDEKCLRRCSRCRHCERWAAKVAKVPQHWRGGPIED
jgi:collagenase-like PrtC family protease